jgi:hypothetical protein
MRSKLLMLIVCGAGVATGVLAVRQQRFHAVHEMTRALERAAEHDRALWRVRAEIARGTRPDNVRRMASALGPFTPMPREPGLPVYAGRDKDRERPRRLVSASHAPQD